MDNNSKMAADFLGLDRNAVEEAGYACDGDKVIFTVKNRIPRGLKTPNKGIKRQRK